MTKETLQINQGGWSIKSPSQSARGQARNTQVSTLDYVQGKQEANKEKEENTKRKHGKKDGISSDVTPAIYGFPLFAGSLEPPNPSLYLIQVFLSPKRVSSCKG